MKSIRVDKAKQMLENVNCSFREGILLPNQMYNFMLEKGIEYKKCVFIDLFQDEDEFRLDFINKDGVIYQIIIFLTESENASMVECTDVYVNAYKQHYKRRPWERYIIAMDFFVEENPDKRWFGKVQSKA